jgi:hypothetical protein
MIEITLKTSWETVSIKDYMAYTMILEDKNTSEFEKTLDILGLMCGMSRENLMPMPARDIMPLFSKLTFLSEKPKSDVKEFYDIGGIKYKLISDVRQMTAGQFIDLSHYTKDPNLIIDNLHLICATLMLPVKQYRGKKFMDKIETERYLETPIAVTSENLYENMPIQEAIGISNFFTCLYSLFTEIMRLYSKEMSQKRLKLALETLKQSERLEILSP